MMPTDTNPPRAAIASSAVATQNRPSDSLPVCVRFPLADADAERAPDAVHRLIRLIAAYEALIKCIGAVAHAVAIDTGIGATKPYASTFHNQFIGKYPALGDHLGLFTNNMKRFRKVAPDWFQEIAERLCESRYTAKTGRDTQVFRLCRAIERHRQSLVSGDTRTYASAVEVLTHFVSFRNTCFHGSVTVRFAGKFDRLLLGAMNELAVQIRFAETIQFLVPLSFAGHDSTKIVALDPEDPKSELKRYSIGERTALKWEDLYVGPRNADSLEEFLRVSPLMIYDRTIEDFRFLNKFANDEFEYLSHKSGDLDFIPLAEANWEDAFGLRIVGDELETEGAPKDDGDVDPAEIEKPIEQPVPKRSTTEVSASALDFAKQLAAFEPSQAIRIAEKSIGDWSDEDVSALVETVTSNKSDLKSDGQVALSKALYGLGLHTESVKVLKNVQKAEPNDAEVAHLLGRSLVMLGKREKSAWKADHKPERLELARSLLADGVDALQESLRLASVDAQSDRLDVFSLSMLVDAYCRLGDFKKAIDACDKGLGINPQNDRLNSQRLFLYERTGS